jgi:outer membrane protein assembly factor BamB
MVDCDSQAGMYNVYDQPKRGFSIMTSARHYRPFRLRTVGAALIALVLPAALVTNFHGRAAAESTAKHAEAGAEGTLAAPLSVAWKFTGEYFGSNPASPVFSEDSAYFVCGNAVYCVSTDTGGLKWRYPSDPEAFLPKLVLFTPSLANGKLYMSAPDGLYVLGAADGKLLARYIPPGRTQVVTSPIVQGDLVYFGAQNGRLYAVDGNTGELAGGAYKPPNRPAGVELGGDLANEPTIVDGVMYYVTANSDVRSINLASGVIRWSEHLTADVSSAKPVFAGDGFYLAAGSTFSNFRALNGQMRWTIPLPTDVAVPPAVDKDGNAYLILADRSIYALNPRGKGFWKKAAHLDNRPLTQPVIAGGLLIVTTALGGIDAFNAATGDLVWSYTMEPSSTNANYVPTGTSVAAKPVVVGDTLYTLSDDGSLTAFSNSAVDTDPPTIDKLEPENGAYINGRPPLTLSAHIMDVGSGLDLSTLAMKLDDHRLPRKSEDTFSAGAADNGFVYKRDTSTVEYTTIENDSGISATLADGHHTVTVSVKDWKGNQLNKTWTFSTDETIKRVQKSNTNTPGQGGVNSGGRGLGAPGTK